jgi:UDP-N-acetylglucosamine--N-acetylmuramyl-(pentapeptide) pyrophosphoryl-undecaprenol N-acetylglucosamine transferase
MPLRTYSPDSAALQASYPELAAFLDRADRGPAVLVTGGSQGALPVNRIVIDMLKTRPDLANRMRLVILTGAAWEEQVRAELGAAAEKVFVAGLVSELPRWLHLFDFAICRSGSSTLWELIRARVPSLLIPLPHAADDHQRLNAVWASSIGPMIEVPQNEMNGQRLASILDEVIGNYRGQRSSGGRWSSRLEQFPESPAEALIEILAEHCPADRVQSSMAIAGPSAASRHLGIHGNG